MNIDLEWTDGIHFLASDDRGHSLSVDGAPALGGRDAGLRPMEMVLVALASCMAIDVVLMLKKARVDLQAMRIGVSAERAESVPKVFSSIHLAFEIRGDGLTKALADRTVNLAGDKYCSVAAMLRPQVSISYSHNVKD